MAIEREQATNRELDPQALEAYASTFFGRTDVYALQRPDGRYRCVKEPLSPELLAAHLYGEVTLGTYALDSHSQARWLCLDADTREQWGSVWELGNALRREGVTPYLEASRRGGHLWLFFASMAGREVRAFGQELMANHNIEGVELFPKQDALTTGPGSLVRLPLGIHRRDGFRYYFLNWRGEPLAPTVRQQMDLLAAPDLVPPEFIAEVFASSQWAQQLYAPSIDRPPNPASAGETLSERIKSSIDLDTFIRRFVVLDARGRGLCPFHEDRHASFSVNQEKGYWNCFAGCGGGSIIDFWMKWREVHGEDPDFVAALKDLANMLL